MCIRDRRYLIQTDQIRLVNLYNFGESITDVSICAIANGEFIVNKFVSEKLRMSYFEWVVKI